MRYEEFVADFAERTFKNLMLVCNPLDKEDKTQSGDEGYEVTQLINSFIGLLIFPKEKHFNSSWKNELKNFPSDEIKESYHAGIRNGCCEYLRCRHGFRVGECSEYFCLVYHLRNAIAHGKIVPNSRISHMPSVEEFEFTDLDKNKKECPQISFVLHKEDIYTILTDLLLHTMHAAPKGYKHIINIQDIEKYASYFAREGVSKKSSTNSNETLQ